MKNLFLIATLLGALFLGACGQKAPAGPKAIRGNANGGGLSNVNSNSKINPGNWGNITPTSPANITAFLSSGTVQVGNVMTSPCTTRLGEPCQINFNVSIDPSSNVMNYNALPLIQIGQGQYQVSGPGVLTVAIYDDITGSIQPGSTYPLSAIGAPAVFVSGQMTYSGNAGYAYLVFQNDAGTVTLGYPPGQNPNGQNTNINGQIFSDDISYQYSNGAQGVLGKFSTSVCYVLGCQQ